VVPIFQAILEPMALPFRKPDLEVLFDRRQIAQRVAQMGEEISRDFAGQSVLLVGVLKGAAVFLADLARNISVETSFDFIAVSSYGRGQQSSGAVKVIKDVDTPIHGRNVILVEDILDSGLTVVFLRRLLEQHQPRSLKLATCLDKPGRRLERIEADYVGFRIPNYFVVGYGMDYAERYRNRPDICVLPPEHPE
jgi:hypoxanthine phosphoribosyltransferase